MAPVPVLALADVWVVTLAKHPSRVSCAADRVTVNQLYATAQQALLIDNISVATFRSKILSPKGLWAGKLERCPP